jgi:hypothetical protein
VNFFSCNINNLPANFASNSRLSYKKYGLFVLKEALDKNEVIKLRNTFDDLFSEPGDDRMRFLRQTKVNSDLRKKMSTGFAANKLNKTLEIIFPEDDISLLPPFNVARNYLPHSIYTRGSGWHRDAGGELAIKKCRALIRKEDYVFGKIGVYLQKNSIYGGAIDTIPGSNNDFYSPTFKKFKVILLLKLLIFFQKFIPFIYKKITRSELYLKLLGSISLEINAGDAVIFDSRVFHKGTFASEEIEKNLTYNIERIQAELPKDKTKYVLYSHFGNSVGCASYFLDRLSRLENQNEGDEWVKDSIALNESNQEPVFFFRKLNSILKKSLFISKEDIN